MQGNWAFVMVNELVIDISCSKYLLMLLAYCSLHSLLKYINVIEWQFITSSEVESDSTGQPLLTSSDQGDDQSEIKFSDIYSKY